MLVERWSAGEHAAEIARTRAAPVYGPAEPGPFAGGRSITDLDLPKEVSIIFDPLGKISPLIYLAGVGLAFVHTGLAGLFYAVAALMWLIPDRRVAKVAPR